MVEVPHTIVGAAIAYKIGNPALALPLAFASHFLLDLVPHWNPHLNREKEKFGRIGAKTRSFLILDSSLALVVGTSLALLALPDIAHFTTIIFACFLAVLPDVLEAPHFFFGFTNGFMKKYIKWHSQYQLNAPFIPGILTQVVTVGAALWWIFS